MTIATALAQTTAPGAPPPVRTSITVVEKIATEAPASVTRLERDDLQGIPAVNADDALRNVPGFTLFRRSSSLTAHPTTQGVSLRGLASSGASRSLVLWDGIPLNDPFGGWVYWTRVPVDMIEHAEVSRGASTSVFGDRAMAGAVGLFSRQPDVPLRVWGSYEGGNRATHELSGGASAMLRHWAAGAAVRAFTTEGFYIVRDRERGPVDQRAGVDFVSGLARLDWFPGSRDRLFLKLDVLAERRANGTLLQNNSTGLGTLAGHYARQQGAQNVSVLAWHTREEFRSTFSTVAADRKTERLSFRQTVPATQAGAAGLYRVAHTRGEFMAGGDFGRVEGYSNDVLFPTGTRTGGGTQRQYGAFVQGNAAFGPLRLFAGGRRHDTGNTVFWSPSAGAVAGRGRVRARGSVYRGFRAPTLNELYREFRQGNAVTQANPLLRPESLWGAEAGVDFVGEATRGSVTLYRNSLEDLIANVTLQSSPTLIVRQRRNATAALARGVEAEFRRRWRHGFEGAAAYLFSDARFATRERIPQSPRHAGSLQLTWLRDGTLASAGVRSAAAQFEDDRNQFVLPGYATVQLAVRQRLRRGLAATVEIENLLDREVLAGFSPVPLVAAPRLWRVGLRWEGRMR